MNQFSEALNREVHRQRLSLTQLAERAGMPRSTLSVWLAGEVKHPEPRTVFKLEAALGLDPGQLSRHLGFVPLEARAVTPGSAEEGIDADPLLNARDRAILLAAYAVMKA